MVFKRVSGQIEFHNAPFISALVLLILSRTQFMPEGIIEPMQFSLITDPARWDELGGEWQALAENTHARSFLEFWYLNLVATLGGGEWQRETSRLHIITARQDGALIGAAPLFFTQRRRPAGLRFIGQVRFRITWISSVRGII